MATIEAQMQQVLTTLTAIQTTLANPPAPPAPVIDFTPVLTPLATLQAAVTDIQNQLEMPPQPNPGPEPVSGS